MAVKIVSTSTALSHEVRARFAREARASARLRSRFSVQVFDTGELPYGTPYIVMEYLDGETLRQHLRRVTRLPLPETVAILTQVARGLERAHEAGIVHRDIKPDNIFLAMTSDDGIVAKVFDFGVAKLVDTHATETIEGTFIGTPQFMSPEQAMGRSDVDHRADVYSLGVLAYRMLTGLNLFEANSIPALLLNICSGTLPLLRDVLPDIPPEVDVWFHRTCARDRESRFSSARECAEALLVAAGLSTSKLSLADSPRSGTHPAQSLSGTHPAQSLSGMHPAQGFADTTPAPVSPVSPLESSAATKSPSITERRPGPSWRSVAAVVGALVALAAAAPLVWPREPKAGVRSSARGREKSAEAQPPAAALPAPNDPPRAAAPSGAAPAAGSSDLELLRTVPSSRPWVPTVKTGRPSASPPPAPAPKHAAPVVATALAPAAPVLSSPVASPRAPESPKSNSSAITDVGY
jgi:serine/threonine-protein kinase